MFISIPIFRRVLSHHARRYSPTGEYTSGSAVKRWSSPARTRCTTQRSEASPISEAPHETSDTTRGRVWPRLAALVAHATFFVLAERLRVHKLHSALVEEDVAEEGAFGAIGLKTEPRLRHKDATRRSLHAMTMPPQGRGGREAEGEAEGKGGGAGI